MKRRAVFSLASMAALALAVTVEAQEASTYEVGSDGVTYRVTRRVVQRSVPTTEYQAREQKVYRPQTATQYQTYQQNYLTPVTEYRWVSRLHGVLNPFVRPYWTHSLEPFTRWQSVPGTVQIPTARTEWVEETRTAQVPVTTYRTVKEEYTSRVAVNVPPSTAPAKLSPAGSTTAIASRPDYGSQRMDSDPPREPSPWSDRSGGTTYTR